MRSPILCSGIRGIAFVLRLPNLLIGGAAQSGTSFIAISIAQHPDISMPTRTVPEPHFFLKSWEYPKGLDVYSQNWFASATAEAAVGEKSLPYLLGGRTITKWIQRDLRSSERRVGQECVSTCRSRSSAKKEKKKKK